MRTTVSTQPQIIIVVCCITLRRSAYGAWGNYSVHDDKGAKITKASFIGHINPLRYRGYYYDRETRLYYLQSRGTTTSPTAGSSTRMGCLQTVLLEQIYLHTV